MEPSSSYRILFEHNPEPMWVYDLESLAFLAVNAAAVEKYGFSLDEFLGMTLRDIRPAEDLARLAASVATSRPGIEHSGTWSHVTRGGSMIDVEITSHDIGWDGRSARLVVARDVTEQLRSRAQLERREAELRNLTADLEHRVARRTEQLAATNAELEAFTYSVSHDLRAPLRQIDGFSKILAEDLAERVGEEGRHYLRRIREGASKMAQLVDDLLDFSRIGRQDIRRVPVDLGRSLEEVLVELGPDREGRRVKLERGILPAAECDPAMIRVVFTNLVSNALKFSRPRDPAVIEIGHKDLKGDPAIFVRDNGVGFDPRYADKIFGVFQRLHRQEDFEGTGVGLATVQRIIHKHGGRVWVEAGPDVGATFYFTLGQPTAPGVSAKGRP
jgi:PAS domain S-box-containing protein